MIMDFFDAFILGIVEGLTEFLPVSSTGHLILAAELLKLPQTEFLKSFEVAIQLGAILAVVVLYFRQLFFEWEIMKRIALALLPALLIGFLFYPLIRKLFESELTVVVALFLGGLLFILFELSPKGKKSQAEEKAGGHADLGTLSYRTAFYVGVFQALAVIPGVSRAGATILGGLLLGMRRTAIVEFSFLLAVPTMVAATTLDLLQYGALFSSGDFQLLAVGFITSFVVAIIAIRFLLGFVWKHTFIPFGIYRIVVATLFFFLVL